MRSFVLLFVAVAVAVAVLVVVLRPMPPTERDLRWLLGPSADDPRAAEVGRVYLSRHRRHRERGAVVGLVLAIVLGVRWYGRVGLGIGEPAPWADLLFCGIAGVVVGALVAETYRLARPAGGPTTASLTSRAPLPGARMSLWSWVVVVAAVAIAVVVLVAEGTLLALGTAVVGAVLVGLAHVTRRAVRDRPRPVLSALAVDVDHALRAFAAQSVAHLQLAIAILTAAWVVASVDSLSPVAEGLSILLVIGGLVAAVVLLRLAAPRPPRRWEPVAA